MTVYVPPIGVETGETSGEDTDGSTDGPAREAEDVGTQAPSQLASRRRNRKTATIPNRIYLTSCLII